MLRRIFTNRAYPQFVVIDLNVRRNQPQCSNFALNIRTRQSHCGSCRSKGGRCQGTNGNSSYIFSAEKCTFIIKYSKAWKWCRTFSANFFDLNVRHQTCLRSFCVEHSGQLPDGNWAECSTELAPIIEFLAQGSIKPEPRWLVPLRQPKMPENEWKPMLRLFH